MAFVGVFTIIVFVLNFILFVGACLMIYVGIFLEYPIHAPDPELDVPSNDAVQKVILGLSIFVALLTFFGCYGVATDNKLYLLMYSTILIILIIINLVIGITVYMHLNSGEETMEKNFEILFNNVTDNNISIALLHLYQEKFDCCGYHGMQDWVKKMGYVPGSCCGKTPEDNCSVLDLIPLPRGCKEIIAKQHNIFMYSFIGIFAFEAILAVCVTCVLMRPTATD